MNVEEEWKVHGPLNQASIGGRYLSELSEGEVDEMIGELEGELVGVIDGWMEVYGEEVGKLIEMLEGKWSWESSARRLGLVEVEPSREI